MNDDYKYEPDLAVAIPTIGNGGVVVAAESDDFSVTRVLCHLVRARLAIDEGRGQDALLETNHAELVARGAEMFQSFLLETLVEIAWIATRAGDRARARNTAEEALRLSEARGNIALAGWAKRGLEEATD